MVDFLGFDWSVMEIMAACAVAALVLCLLIHLCAAACGWNDFFRCYAACGSALMSCCGLRPGKEKKDYVTPLADDERPRRPTRRGRRRRDEEGGGGGGPVGPLVTVNIQTTTEPGKRSVTLVDSRGKRTKAPQDPSEPAADGANGDGGQAEQQAGAMPLLPFSLVWTSRV